MYIYIYMHVRIYPRGCVALGFRLNPTRVPETPTATCSTAIRKWLCKCSMRLRVGEGSGRV